MHISLHDLQNCYKDSEIPDYASEGLAKYINTYATVPTSTS